MRFGLMQTKVGLITLLNKYKFDVCDKTPIPMVFDPRSNFISADGGVHLQISTAD
jgi:cytochrome P450 family 6